MEDLMARCPLPVQMYARAWNAHDSEAVAAMFGTDGTYEDPSTGGPLTGFKIAQTISALVAAFPDFSISLTHVALGDPDLVTIGWTLTGTHTGPFGNIAPTGRAVRLSGVDVIRINGDTLRSVTGYFSRPTITEQVS